MSAEGRATPHIVTDVPGPRSRALGERLVRVECPAFDARRKDRAATSGEDYEPIVYAEGLGANVWDVDGNRYVDLVAGFGALSFGHRAPFIETRVEAQQAKLGLALGDVYASDVKVALLEELRALHGDPFARVMLGLSGADAVTAALKTSVLATGKPGVVAFEGGYHGLSHGPLAACGLRDAFRSPFTGQTGAFARFVPYPKSKSQLSLSLRATRAVLAGGDVGAVLVEPMLGRGGVVLPPDAFLPELASLARSHGALLIADEIWTGMGRSGVALESKRAQVSPDLVCVGKALGAGMAISACIGTGSAMEAWGAHGGATLHTATHFGAPPACAAALAVLERLRQPGFLEAVERKGQLLRAAIQEHCGKRARAVRGRGLMVGVELEGGAAKALAISQRLLRSGYIVLTGGSAGNVITLTPSLTIDDALFEPFAAVFGEALEGER